MGRANKGFQCWVCKRAYPADQLGRVIIPESFSRSDRPVFRVICEACYASVRDYAIIELGEEPPALHGF